LIIVGRQLCQSGLVSKFDTMISFCRTNGYSRATVALALGIYPFVTYSKKRCYILHKRVRAVDIYGPLRYHSNEEFEAFGLCRPANTDDIDSWLREPWHIQLFENNSAETNYREGSAYFNGISIYGNGYYPDRIG